MPEPQMVPIFDNEGRTCSKCKRYKEWKLFHKCASNNTGYAAICSECRRPIERERAKKYMEADPEKYRTKAREAYQLKKKKGHETLRQIEKRNRERFMRDLGLRMIRARAVANRAVDKENKRHAARLAAIAKRLEKTGVLAEARSKLKMGWTISAIDFRFSRWGNMVPPVNLQKYGLPPKDEAANGDHP